MSLLISTKSITLCSRLFYVFLSLVINPVLFPTKLFVTISACIFNIPASIVPFGDILCGSPTMYCSPSLLLASSSIINPFPCTKALDRINQLYDYCRKLNLSILGICESKLDDTISTSIYSIPGYNLEHLHRNRHGGGILCYIHESLPYVRRQNLEVKSKEIEQISIDVTIKNKIVNINILYRPPDDHLESQN